MRGFGAIYRRELAALFLGPLAWTLLCIALLLNGYLFLIYLRGSGGDVDLALRFSLGESFVFWALCVLFPPLLTMRMLSEESRTGMLEYLLTAPVSDVAVICGKFAAALSFMGILWGSVFVYAGVLAWQGAPIDWGVVCASWLGAVLCSALFCGTGLWTSSLTGTPVVAAFAAVVINLVIVLLPLLAGLSGVTALAIASETVDVPSHLRSAFVFGVIDTAYVVFFLAWSAFFLFLSTRALEARRWR
ncbi:MAG: ABC-2 transporter permease [Planctomycetes bacterium]|nr:ABC-2 transporter permease [Planctomycetota bacterium]